MPGHQWEVIDTNGEQYFVVTKRNDEEQARTTFHNTLGHRVKIKKVQYMNFVHAVQ